MRNRWTAVLALAVLATTAACDDGGGEETAFGEYAIAVFENRDTCEGELNEFGSTLVLSATQGSQIEVEFGGFPAIVGTIDAENELMAQGVVEDDGEGATTTLVLENVAFFFGGSVEGEGSIAYDGTFPDPEVTEPCVQEFTFEGEKVGTSRAPLLPTAPGTR